MALNTEQELKDQISESSGLDASWQSFGVVGDQVPALVEDIQKGAHTR